MKKILAAVFSGALFLALSAVPASAFVNANLGFRATFKLPKANCSAGCTTQCRSFRQKKCNTAVAWKKSCQTHHTTWESKCQTYRNKKTVCAPVKSCHQRCIKYVNNKGEYTKCFGKLNCKYIPGCRTEYFNNTVCRPIAKKHTTCTNRPTYTRRCTTALRPGYCKTKCGVICKGKK
jgi:hypothetical protein